MISYVFTELCLVYFSCAWWMFQIEKWEVDFLRFSGFFDEWNTINITAVIFIS